MIILGIILRVKFFVYFGSLKMFVLFDFVWKEGCYILCVVLELKIV